MLLNSILSFAFYSTYTVSRIVSLAFWLLCRDQKVTKFIFGDIYKYDLNLFPLEPAVLMKWFYV